MKKTILMIMLALLGMSQLGAQEYEYVPFVREGVKWVCFYDNPCFVDEGFIPFGEHYFVLEIKGDICIDGKWYKPVHYYSGYSINEENDTVPVYLREENKVVYGIIPDDRRYWECPVGIGTIVNGLELYSDVKTSMEFILYDFNDPVGFYENLCPEISPRLHYSHEEMVQIGNSLRKRLVFNRIGSPDVYLGHEYIIEGIGYVGESPGMPLNYFYDINTGNIQVIYKLSHVIENGQIVYKTQWYDPDITLGIGEVVADQPERMTDGNYYNLMGQPVGKDVPTVPGIYIHQGKKILVI